MQSQDHRWLRLMHCMRMWECCLILSIFAITKSFQNLSQTLFRHVGRGSTPEKEKIECNFRGTKIQKVKFWLFEGGAPWNWIPRIRNWKAYTVNIIQNRCIITRWIHWICKSEFICKSIHTILNIFRDFFNLNNLYRIWSCHLHRTFIGLPFTIRKF